MYLRTLWANDPVHAIARPFELEPIISAAKPVMYDTAVRFAAESVSAALEPHLTRYLGSSLRNGHSGFGFSRASLPSVLQCAPLEGYPVISSCVSPADNSELTSKELDSGSNAYHILVMLSFTIKVG